MGFWKNCSLKSITFMTKFILLQIFHNEKILMRRTWDEAEALCQDFGAHLASFSHIYEEIFLNNLLYTIFDR